MKKKQVTKTCSHCGDLVPEGKEFIEFKGSYFHPDHITCISNLKVKVESLRRILIDINSQTNHIP